MIPFSTTPLVVFEAIGDTKMLELLAAAQTDPVVALILLKAAAADRVRRDDPRLREGLQILVTKNLLTQEEVNNLIGEANV